MIRRVVLALSLIGAGLGLLLAEPAAADSCVGVAHMSVQGGSIALLSGTATTYSMNVPAGSTCPGGLWASGSINAGTSCITGGGTGTMNWASVGEVMVFGGVLGGSVTGVGLMVPDELSGSDCVLNGAIEFIIPLVGSVPGGPGTWSGTCSYGAIDDGSTFGVYHRLYEQPSGDSTWVCWRVGSVGGRIDLATSGAPTTDTLYTACSTTSGNSAPGPHPYAQGTLAGVQYLVDAYMNGSSLWVCFGQGGTGTRLIFPVGTQTLPVFHLD